MSSYRYRDIESGEYVSEETYNRSVAQGGEHIERVEVFNSVDDFYDYNTDFDPEEFDYVEYAGSQYDNT